MQKRTQPDALAVINTKGLQTTNAALCAKRFPPCSTFKIVLALEGLDSGLVKGESELWRWDKTPSTRSEEKRDLTLKSALEVSSEWYFRAVARKLGATGVRRALTRLLYGSGWKGSAVADCWHDGTLLISPNEQVALMAKLSVGQLAYKPEHQALVRTCLTVPKTTIWGKTGTGEGIAWYVGAATVGGKPVAFATFQQGKGVLGPRLREAMVARLTHGGNHDEGGEP